MVPAASSQGESPVMAQERSADALRAGMRLAQARLEAAKRGAAYVPAHSLYWVELPVPGGGAGLRSRNCLRSTMPRQPRDR